MSKKGRYLGIDYGLSRIGLALSDERKIIASPFKTIPAQRTTLLSAESLLSIILENSVELIVVGLPKRMNGKNSMMTDEVEHFVKCLSEKVSCPVVTIDERLTSLQADKHLREADLNRKKRSQNVDIVAAALLLQNYLDRCTLQNETLI